MVRYISFPTRRLYDEGSSSNSPSDCVKAKFCSIGNLAGLAPKNPVSSRISNAYCNAPSPVKGGGNVNLSGAAQQKHTNIQYNSIPSSKSSDKRDTYMQCT